MNKEIAFKGCMDGIKVYFGEGISMEKNLQNLEYAINRSIDFFKHGKCKLFFLEQEYTLEEQKKIRGIVEKLLPEGEVFFQESKKSEKFPNALEEEYSLFYNGKDFITDTLFYRWNDEKDENQYPPLKRLSDVSITNLKSTRARWYEGNVSSGKVLESDGHLILMGSVEKGAMIRAAGNIIVMGNLKGYAWAGVSGNKQSYIVASDLSPTDIQIANIHIQYPGDIEREEKTVEIAYLINNKIYVDDFLLK